MRPRRIPERIAAMTTTSDTDISRRAVLAGGALITAAPLLAAQSAPAQAQMPMFGAIRPSVYRVKLGGFEITTILDGSVQTDGPVGTFGVNQGEADVKKFAADHLLPETRMENSYTPVIVNTGQEIILFDTGNGAARRPDAGKLAATLDIAGLKSDQVSIVVITHCHGDHIGGLMESGSPTFPKARYVIGQAEYDFWSHKDRLTGPTENAAKLVQTNVVPLAEKMTFLQPGQDVVTGITSIDVSGHTPGMLAFNIESEGKRIVITADTVNHYVMSLEQPEWHVRFDMNKEKGAATRKRVLDMLANEKVPFTGYHMPFPTIGYVEKAGEGFRWAPHTYQLRV
jgi:glyoxylase-like metal-dependent hydrolase (beta-lactamase superfamily II)